MNIENRELSQKLVDTIEFLNQSISKISVYDLNYYSMSELYYNIGKKINELIEMYHEFGVSISEEIIKQNECLQYLLNEGLKEEVITKIDKMLLDGTLNDLINHDIFKTLNDKIDTKANKTSMNIELNNKVSKGDLQLALDNIGSMSPKGVYAHMTELNQVFPNGSQGIYLTNDNKNWNYWDGSQWVAGGIYEKNAIDYYSITYDKIKTPYQVGYLTHGYFEIDTVSETITPKLEPSMGVIVMTVPSRGTVTLSLVVDTPIPFSFSSTLINQIFYDMTNNTLKVVTKPEDVTNYNSNLIYLGAIYGNCFYGDLNKTRFKINGSFLQDNKQGHIFNGFINFDTNTRKLTITGNRYFPGNAWIYSTNSTNIELPSNLYKYITVSDRIQHVTYDIKSKGLILLDNFDFPLNSTNLIYICSIYGNKLLDNVNSDCYKINDRQLSVKNYGVANIVLGSININTVDKKLEFTNGDFGFYLASNIGQYTYKSVGGNIDDIKIEVDNNRFNTLFYDTEENTFTVGVVRKSETELAIATFYANKFVWSNSANLTINKVIINPFAYQSQIANETITCIGDSMTRGYTLPIEKSWVQLIANRNNAKMLNWGISGCCMSATQSPGATVEQSIVRRIKDITNDNDRIIVYGGYNDAFLNVPLGDKNSADETTFYGALNIIIDYLQTNFPTKKIGFITPFKFQDNFQPYINAIIEKCEENNIKVFKNHIEGGINYKNNKHVELLTMGDVHLSEEGLKLVSYKYEDFIKSL